MTIEDIINYVDSRKFGTNLETWTWDQIGVYIWESVNSKNLRVAIKAPDEILGVIIFNANIRGQFWVNQFFGGGKEMWMLFLIQLFREFPDVKEIWGLRKRRNAFIPFNVSTLNKLYGRRCTSTTSK